MSELIEYDMTTGMQAQFAPEFEARLERLSNRNGGAMLAEAMNVIDALMARGVVLRHSYSVTVSRRGDKQRVTVRGGRE